MDIDITVTAKLGNLTVENISLTVSDGDDLDSLNETIFEDNFADLDDLPDDADASQVTLEVTDWGDVGDYPNLQSLDTLFEICEYTGSYEMDVVSAAYACDIQIEDIDEAYNGYYKDDEEFTQELLESYGDIPSNLPGYVHIDWESTARDIMMDYSEDSGHYFRNL
jgi:antirestriction protein